MDRSRYDEYLVYAALLCLVLLLWCESDEQVVFDGKANVFVLRRRNLLCFTRFHIATTLDAINNIELVEETSYMIGHTSRYDWVWSRLHCHYTNITQASHAVALPANFF